MTFAVLTLPWIKYYIHTNPLAYNLGERFVQQISTSMDDMPVLEVTKAGRDIISQAKVILIHFDLTLTTLVQHYRQYHPLRCLFAFSVCTRCVAHCLRQALPEQATRLDAWTFVPHYPYPQQAVGMRLGSRLVAYRVLPCSCSLM